MRKRRDGYHEIRTVFHEIDLYDSLIFSLTDSSEIEVLTDTDDIECEENLVFKTASLIRQEYKVDKGVNIKLEKRIPISAGLGGGSSDAAQTILGLDELWNLGLTPEQMNRIGEQLGSDVSFFLVGGTAAGTGRGECIEPLPDWHLSNLLLIKPEFGISSGEAYKMCVPRDDPDSWNRYLDERDIQLASNDLEPAIRTRYPLIGQILDDLHALGITAILSGSGPTIVGFCPDQDTALSLAGEFEKKGHWTCVTGTREKGR